MRISLFCFGLLLLAPYTSANQKIAFKKVCDLPKALHESSGLLEYHGLLWTHADSGDERLYGLDPVSCKPKTILRIKNSKNRDWEAITADKHFIYVADIGNNNGTRRNLVIYRLNVHDINWRHKQQRIAAKKIFLSYPEQRHFKSTPRNTPFDAEAIIADHNKLYVITKNWRNHDSYVYELPNKPGRYQAIRISKLSNAGLITDANLSHHELTLLGYSIALWGLQPYLLTYHWPLNAQPFALKKQYLKLTGQTEGLSSTNNTHWYVSREYAFAKPATIFSGQSPS